ATARASSGCTSPRVPCGARRIFRVLASILTVFHLRQPTRMVTTAASRSRLTSNQVRGFWAAWGGWALDGMDSFIYALVLAPALRELLPQSGIANTAENVGYY